MNNKRGRMLVVAWVILMILLFLWAMTRKPKLGGPVAGATPTPEETAVAGATGTRTPGGKGTPGPHGTKDPGVHVASVGPDLAMIPVQTPDPTLINLPPDATPTPTPKAFCPIGTVERSSDGPTGKERYCLRDDRVGIPFREGPYVGLFKNGKTRLAGVYEAGLKAGTWTEYLPDGKTREQGTYRKGVRNGEWTFWWENGQKSQQGTFRSGEKNGPWKFFDEQGRKESEGTLRTSENRQQEQGRWTYFHPNGKKKSEGHFDLGRREGMWREWDERGVMTSLDVYRDGEREPR